MGYEFWKNHSTSSYLLSFQAAKPIALVDAVAPFALRITTLSVQLQAYLCGTLQCSALTTAQERTRPWFGLLGTRGDSLPVAAQPGSEAK